MSNPFYAEWPSPFGLPSFSDIEPIHFEEAFQAGFDQNNEEIDTIANSLEDPTFANTVVELERAGELLSRVADVFFNLSIADTNDQIEALELKIAPCLAVPNDYRWGRTYEGFSENTALVTELGNAAPTKSQPNKKSSIAFSNLAQLIKNQFVDR